MLNCFMSSGPRVYWKKPFYLGGRGRGNVCVHVSSETPLCGIILAMLLLFGLGKSKIKTEPNWQYIGLLLCYALLIQWFSITYQWKVQNLSDIDLMVIKKILTKWYCLVNLKRYSSSFPSEKNSLNNVLDRGDDSGREVVFCFRR